MTEELSATLKLVAALRRSAMNSLGRREHSVFELSQKLRQRFEDASDKEISNVIERLRSQGLQSDQRFAEMFVRSRISRGKGPSLIRRELEQQNLNSNLMDQAFKQNPCDWQQSALQQLQKKYSVTDMQDYTLRAKAAQFLYRRGFDGDISNRAIDMFKNSKQSI